MATQIVPPEVAVGLLEYSGQVGNGKKKWPPEIEAKRKELKEANRLFRLFRSRFGVYDEGLRRMKDRSNAELDRLYVEFGETLTRAP